MKSNKTLKAILSVYGVMAVLIPIIIWIIYHRMSWTSWNGMILSYLGSAIGGVATLIAVLISTNQTREVQDKSEKDNAMQRRLNLMVLGTKIMPIMNININNWRNENLIIKIENKGLNAGKIKTIKINESILKKDILINTNEPAYIYVKEFTNINISKMITKSEKITVYIEFLDLINNLYEQKFEIKSKDTSTCEVISNIPRIKKIAEIDEDILRD